MVANSYLEPLNVLDMVVHHGYPCGVIFELYNSFDTDRYKIECLTCRDIGLTWVYAIDQTMLILAKTPDIPYLFIKNKLVCHAEGHGSDVARALIQKYLKKDKCGLPPLNSVKQQIEEYYQDLAEEKKIQELKESNWKRVCVGRNIEFGNAEDD